MDIDGSYKSTAVKNGSRWVWSTSLWLWL